jgi:hypothetical protein
MKESMSEAGYKYIRFDRGTGLHILRNLFTNEYARGVSE